MRLAILLTILLATAASADRYRIAGELTGLSSMRAIEIAAQSGMLAYDGKLGILDTSVLHDLKIAADLPVHATALLRYGDVGYTITDTTPPTLVAVSLDGAASTVLSTTPLLGSVRATAMSDAMSIVGDTLYLCAQDVFIFDISNPGYPQLQLQQQVIDDWWGTKPPERHDCRVLHATGNRVWVGAEPQIIGWYDVTTGPELEWTAICHHPTTEIMMVDGKLCYAGPDQVVMCHTPTYTETGAPPQESIWQSDEYPYPYDLATSGGMLYGYWPTATWPDPGEGVLRVLAMDWSMGDPIELANIEVEPHHYLIAAHDDIWVTGDEDGTLTIRVPEPPQWLAWACLLPVMAGMRGRG